jgi:integrase
VLTADEARQEARLDLAEVAKGGDPAARRAEAREALTVADLCREYIDKAEKGLVLTRRGKPKKGSTLYIDKGRIERHVIPLLGRRTVADLTSADLRAFVRDVIAGKTAADIKTERGRSIVAGGPGAASRTMGLLGGILSWAVGEGYRPDNPAKGVIRPADNKRRIHLSADQYAALGRALEAAEAGGERWQAICAARLMALTGARVSEVVKLKRSECDVPGSCLRLGDSKTGESVRPLGKPALAVLQAALARSNAPIVFPPVLRDTGHFGAIKSAWARFRKAEPALDSLTWHGLRHAFASVADDLGYTEATIGAMLGHSGGGTTHRYIHKLDPALIAAADRVAGRVADLMAGIADAGADVVEVAGVPPASAI